MAFPVAQRVKKSASSEGNRGSNSEFERTPGEGNGNPLQYSCLENQRSLGDYSPYYWKKHSFDYMNFCQ